jgi:hypothetical protein
MPVYYTDSESDQELPYCEPCNRKFVNDHALRQHDLARHRDLYCEACDKFFQTANGLSSHKQNSRRYLDCLFDCNFSSRTHDKFEAHCINVHRYCHICGIYPDNTHFAQFHHGCNSCGERFGDNNQLIQVCSNAIFNQSTGDETDFPVAQEDPRSTLHAPRPAPRVTTLSLVLQR